MAYNQQPGITSTIAGGGQYDDLDTANAAQYNDFTAAKAAEAAASATAAENSADSSLASANQASVSAAAALVSEGNASDSEDAASLSEAAAAQSAIDATNASRLTAGTTTTGNPGSNAAVAITGAAGSQVLNLTIPRGDIGATGITGTAATIAVGTTTTGAAGSNATVTNTGTTADAVFNFSVPQGIQGIQGIQGVQGDQGIQGIQGIQGDTGDTGTAATIAAGTITTLSPGASATVANSGTTAAAVFDFGIPQGNTGATGATGTAATIAVGTTTTGAPGTSATVTNTGTSAVAVFDFSIPSGAGVSTGGTTGQFLAKASNTDYDTQWLSITGALSYLGSWNASTNTPTVTSGFGINGGYYVVSVSGSTSIDGITDWVIGDWIIFNGSTWQKIDQTNLVTSVAGRTGAITLSSVDIANFELQQLDDVLITTATDGQVLTYESATNLWKNRDIDGLPSQTGNEGKFLTTDGTDPSWATVDALPSQSGNDGSTLRTDGTNAYWAPTVNITSQRQIYTATSGQTTFNATYDVGYVDVYLNGVKLIVGIDFTATTGTTIVLTTGAIVGDTIDIVAYGTSLIAVQVNSADGGFANSVYTAPQSINGGTANG